MAYEDLKQRYNKYRNRVSDTKLVKLLIIKYVVAWEQVEIYSSQLDHRTVKFIKY